MNTSRHQYTYFENLDTLRAISALFVVFFHAGLYDLVSYCTSNKILLAGATILSGGTWGVSFFFVLSGFLISWLLFLEYEKFGKIAIKEFYLRRIFRIWPLYYLNIVIFCIVLPLVYKVTGKPIFFDYNILLHLIFLSNFDAMTINAAYDSVRSFPLVARISWSVSIEEQFYIVWPLLFAKIKKRNWQLLLFSVLVISFLNVLKFGNDYHQFYLNTLIRASELAIGGYLAYAAFYDEKFFLFFQKVPRGVLIVIYLLPLPIMLEFRYFHDVLMNVPLIKANEFITMYFLRLIAAVCFGCIILEQNFNTQSFFKLKNAKLLSRIGKYTYGLYMLHPTVLFFVNIACLAFIHNVLLQKVAVLVFTTVGSIFIAKLSYQYFEKPFLKLKSKYSKL